MRRNTLPTSIVGSIALTAALSLAYAATNSVDSTNEFNRNDVADNISTGGNQLTINLIDNTYGDWIRKDYDRGATWGMELQKDSASGIWASDSCLAAADNVFGDETNVGGTIYRTGSLDGSHTLVDGANLQFSNTNEISEIRFLTHGARTADPTNVPAPTTNYLITVSTDGSGTSTFTIPIAAADQASRGGSGSGSTFGSWSSSSYSGLTGVATDPECLGNEGDEVVIDLGSFLPVTDIDIAYQDETEVVDDDTAAGESWLGGPFALVTDAIEADVEDDFEWRASYRSSSSTSDAVSAGGNAIWHEVAWTASSISTDTDVFLRVRCATDIDGNGTLSGSEFKDMDGGDTGDTAWYPPLGSPGINLRDAGNPTTVPDCTGEFLQYELEFYPEFDVAPIIDQIDFTYNPDYDSDGYAAEAGHGLVDCNDANPALNWADADGDGFNTCQTVNPDCDDTPGTGASIFPGAALTPADVDDNTDRDCDGAEECFFDFDNDGFGIATDIRNEQGTINGDCDGNREADVAGDCEDALTDVYPGAPINSLDVADGIDGDCNGAEECYADQDGDGFGSNTIIDESSDPDLLCEQANNEATVGTDCDDNASTGALSYPGKVITSAEIDDGLDNNCTNNGAGDECWADVDDDGFGNNQGNVVESTDKDCTDTGEAITANDCRDSGSLNGVQPEEIFPGATIGASQIQNGVDDNCSENGDGSDGDECWADVDDDGYGNDDGVFVDSPDLTCNATGEAPASNNNDCLDDPAVDAKASQVFPGASIDAGDIGDGLDDNCSHAGAGDECWADADDDGFGNDDGIHVDSADKDCTDTGEAVASNNNDCLDTGSGADEVYPGAPLDASDVDDNIDGDCSNNGAGDECWADVDQDGFGNDDGVIVQSSDKDCNDTGEAAAANTSDCLDDPAVDSRASGIFPGAPIDATDIDDDVDSNCSNGGAGDECWADVDDDGFGNDDGVFVESGDKDCNDTGEAPATSNNDCLDDPAVDAKAPQVFPGASIESSDIQDGIDDNCTHGGAGDECWLDADDDNFGNDDGLHIESADKDCSDTNEAPASSNNDCLDDPAIETRAGEIYPGAPIDANDIDDNLDGNCSAGGSGDECWSDIDRDGFGNDDGEFVESSDTDCDDAGEAVRANDNDCLDDPADNSMAVDVYPGAPIDAVDIDDDLDSNCSAGGAGDECWLDDDQDGFGNDDGLHIESADKDCNDTREAPAGDNADCLDDSGNVRASDIFPGAPIDANDIDDDLDGNCSAGGAGDECWRDEDDDGFGNDDGLYVESPDKACTATGEAIRANNTDCLDDPVNPEAPDVYPGAPIEAVDIDDDIDSNCSNGGNGDECWADDDEDGFGNDDGVFAESSDKDCLDLGEAIRSNNTDCLDDSAVPKAPFVYPGASIEQTDIADGIDSNCSNGGSGDECWLDDDADSFGNDDGLFVESPDTSCNATGESTVATDCLDTSTNPKAPNVFPGASIENSDIDDGIDSNCSNAGLGDECWADADRDGFGNDEGNFVEAPDGDCTDLGEALSFNDCDDADGQSYPGKVITDADIGDGVDNNCVGGVDECWRDSDGDGFGDEARIPVEDSGVTGCLPGENQSTNDGDCDDTDITFNPSIDDTCAGLGGDGLDNDCDGHIFDDETNPNPLDGDGLTWAEEQSFGTDDCLVDTDFDGIDDVDEYNYFCGAASVLSLEGNNDDTDGDGVIDGSEELVVDTDGDGIKNPCDADDDGDGIPTSTELAFGDTDSDGIPDYLDDDDDDDGILTEDERGGTTPATFTDTDTNGVPDYRDDDDDGDSLLTAYERSFGAATFDLDNDGDPNHLDLDSDGDGFSDDHEENYPQGPNADNTDLPDFLDTDSDNDSIPDADERGPSGPYDSDNDGIEDRVEVDDDDDGILTSREASFPAYADPDNDGIPNWREIDSDDDNYLDSVEENTVQGRDVDGDGIPNFLDDDSDGDSVPDDRELDEDRDGDGRVNRVDDDDDGDSVPTIEEIPVWPYDGSTGTPWTFNTDGTAPVNYLDDDDDDDGLLTIQELAYSTAERALAGDPGDPDNDGEPSYRDDDSDGDTWLDSEEMVGSTPHTHDYDTDGVRDFLDLDSDDDLVPDVDERRANTDATNGSPNPDSQPNRNDADDDGDGINTIQERSDNTPRDLPEDSDFDGSGGPNYLDLDSDGDGWSDTREWTETRPGSSGRDSDGDGARDFLDLDSDDDTIPDAEEFDLDVDSSGGDNRVDADDDGDDVPTAFEMGPVAPNTNWNTFSSADDDDCSAAVLALTANNDCPDYLDPDDDDDGIDTSTELALGNTGPFSSWTDVMDSAHDTDEAYAVQDDGTLCGRSASDSCPDFVDPDDDNDSLDTADEPFRCSSSGTNTLDYDNDGIPDYRDEDDDDDGILTAFELSAGPNMDVNDDGNCNHRDNDADSDGFSDSHEYTVGGVDFDSDGVPDFLDLDSDGDSVPDADEGIGRNTDVTNAWPGMGLPDDLEDRVDPDDDNDGIPTSLEGSVCAQAPNAADCGNADQLDNDWDDDGVPDYRDADDDGDGISTLAELIGANSVTWPLAVTAPSAERDYDGDGAPDFADPDDDDDTIPTVAERLCGDASTPPIRAVYGGGSVAIEVLVDPDGDSLPNSNDTDDDGDTLLTAEEQLHGGGDADGDSCVNAFDTDSDEDGWPDVYEGLADTDGDNGELGPDAGLDFVDLDSDGDLVPDAFELDPLDDPAYPGGVWNEAVADWSTPPPDYDGDGIEDRLDTDDDEDGIPTAYERYRCDEGDGGDTLASTVWDDMVALKPGLETCVDSATGHPGRFDWDGDGLWNYLDADDDDDNVPTAMEDYDYTYVMSLVDHDNDTYTPLVAATDPGPQPEVDDQNDGFDMGSFVLVDDGDPAADKNDTDGDGAPDFLDVDDDGDGLGTVLEDWLSPGEPWNTNTNPHGDPDDLLDIHPREFGNSLPDFLDPDDDGDGLSTVLEDLDGNGDPRDDHSNGQPTALLLDLCSDPLGVQVGCYDDTPDFRDVDDEGDGAPTWAENRLLPGGGVGQPYIADSDNDGILDGEEWINFLDIGPGTLQVTIDEFAGVDVSSVCNGLQTDDNGDGIPDALVGRWWFEPWDRDCNGTPNFLDIDDDGDGFNTNENYDNEDDIDCIGPLVGEGDGIPSYLDIDSDNETLTVPPGVGDCPASTPLPGCVLRTDAEEGDGDIDSDGEWDGWDCDASGPNGDSDGDRIPNRLEGTDPSLTNSFCKEYATFRQDSPSWPEDDCGDTVPRLQGSCHLSPDSDCDGVLDCEEAGILMSDGAGNPVDVDGNGQFDDYDPNPCASDEIVTDALLPELRDSDGDEIPDMFDRDDDRDGISTPYELSFYRTIPEYIDDTSSSSSRQDLFDAFGMLLSGCDDLSMRAGPDTLTPIVNNGTLAGWGWACVDNDGNPELPPAFSESANIPWSRNTDAPGNLDVVNADNVPDYLDDDDDGDSLPGYPRPTLIEDDPEQSLSQLTPNYLDQDGDLVPNWLDPYDFGGENSGADADLDGIPNRVEEQLGLSPFSDDSDNDGIPDSIEVGDVSNPTDTDNDGIIDALDDDDDGDSLPSSVEGIGDQDGDGIPNFLDDDSDNDGVPDGDEVEEDGSFRDSDCDGLADHLDDSDDSDVFCNTADTGVPVEDEGCGGCSSSGPSGFAGLFGLFTLSLMRRRR